MNPLFIDANELATLTGRKLKSQQIAWLRTSGIPFRVNALGRPVVTRSAVEGRQETVPVQSTGWTPRVIGA
jgi:hypothetical protein